MNAQDRCSLFCLCCALPLQWVAFPAWADDVPPEVEIRSIDFLDSLTVRPGGARWVVIESSPDLRSWTPQINVFTTNTSTPYVRNHDPSEPVLFFKARCPGVSVSEAMVRWSLFQPASYRYRLVRNVHRDTQWLQLEGLVQVDGDSRTISDITLNGQPTTDFVEQEFPSPDELFGLLSHAWTEGARFVQVAYDPTTGFPTTVMISKADVSPSGLLQLAIRDFELIQGAAGSPRRRSTAAAPNGARNSFTPAGTWIRPLPSKPCFAVSNH